MPLSTRDEILKAYAASLPEMEADVAASGKALLQDPSVAPTAAPGIGSELASGAEQAAGWTAGGAVLKKVPSLWAAVKTMLGVGGAATGTAEIVAGAEASAGATGIMGTIGAALAGIGPIGWVLLGIGAVATYLIWQYAKVSGENVDKVISALGTLDPKDGQIKNTIQQWQLKLKTLNDTFKMNPPENPEQRATFNHALLSRYEPLIAQLKEIQVDWPNVEKGCSDWKLGFISDDLGRAKKAIDDALNTAVAQNQDIATKLQQESKEFVAKAEKDQGKNYTLIAQQVVQMKKQLETTVGKVELNNDETSGNTLAEDIVGGKSDPQEIGDEAARMMTLHDTLEQAIKAFAAPVQQKPTAPTTQTASTNSRSLSKRALTVGGKTFGPSGQTQSPAGQSGSGIAGKGRRARDPNVVAIQKSVNWLLANNMNAILAANKLEDFPLIVIDGVYGPETAKALTVLFRTFPSYLSSVQRGSEVGLTTGYIGQYQKIRTDSDALSNLSTQLTSLIQQERGGPSGVAGVGQAQPQQPDQVPPPPAQIPPPPMMQDQSEQQAPPAYEGSGYPAPYYPGVMPVMEVGVGGYGRGYRPAPPMRYPQRPVTGPARPVSRPTRPMGGRRGRGALSQRDVLRKEAGTGTDLKDAIIHLWRPDQGFFENIFRLLASNALIFIPGVGVALWVFEKIAEVLGHGPVPALGRWIDQELGLPPGAEITQEHMEAGGRLLQNAVEKALADKTASYQNCGIQKEAFLGMGLLYRYLVPKIPAAMMLIMKVVTVILGTLGISQISELYERAKKDPGSVGDLAGKLVNKVTNNDGSNEEDIPELTPEEQSDIAENEG